MVEPWRMRAKLPRSGKPTEARRRGGVVGLGEVRGAWTVRVGVSTRGLR